MNSTRQVWCLLLTPSTVVSSLLLSLVQAMMFMAGANSIFTGDRLLTTSNPEFDADKVIKNEKAVIFLQ